MHNDKRPFESDGRFFAGKVENPGPNGKMIRRRLLCFAFNTPSGVPVVAASPTFSRAEAYFGARRAALAAGLLAIA